MPENVLVLVDWRLAALVDDTMPPRDPNGDDDEEEEDEDENDDDDDDDHDEEEEEVGDAELFVDPNGFDVTPKNPPARQIYRTGDRPIQNDSGPGQ
jgi:hypothetical protein